MFVTVDVNRIPRKRKSEDDDEMDTKRRRIDVDRHDGPSSSSTSNYLDNLTNGESENQGNAENEIPADDESNPIPQMEDNEIVNPVLDMDHLFLLSIYPFLTGLTNVQKIEIRLAIWNQLKEVIGSNVVV